MLTVYETDEGLMVQRGRSFIQFELSNDKEMVKRLLSRLESEGRIRFIRREILL